ncbi:MAG: hypothetical protein A2W80_09785 [Candidatus Riflebacteria bacterium GWC2_50_8]|nr:MAG: hypothetical protein A2W80_09785 [Candidatus Riflebacteria bacterium GWC2_50_8]
MATPSPCRSRQQAALHVKPDGPPTQAGEFRQLPDTDFFRFHDLNIAIYSTVVNETVCVDKKVFPKGLLILINTSGAEKPALTAPGKCNKEKAMTSKRAEGDQGVTQLTADYSEHHGRKVFSLLNDFVFKCVFGQEKNEALAICLLNALLKNSGSRKITSLEFLNPFNLKEAAEQKASVVDVKVRDGENRCYIIEVQVCRHKFFVPRTVYYLARLYSGQLLVGEDYSALQTSTGISILDFDLFEDCAEMHNIFEFRNRQGTLNLPETMILHYIELQKFSRNKPRHLKTPFEKWLQVLKFSEKYITMGSLPDYLANEEGVAMAVSQLKKVNADREMRQILEAREKEARFVSMMKRIANEEGHEAGLKEGLKEGRKEGSKESSIEIALKLYQRGVAIDLISETTGISEAELNKLIKNHS